MQSARKSVIIICNTDSYTLNTCRNQIRAYFSKAGANFTFIHDGKKLFNYINKNTAKTLSIQVICTNLDKSAVVSQLVGSGIDYQVIIWSELRSDLELGRECDINSYNAVGHPYGLNTTTPVENKKGKGCTMLFLCKEIPSLKDREYIAKRAGCFAQRVAALCDYQLMTSGVINPVAMFVKSDVQAYYKFVRSRGEDNVKAMTWNIHSVYTINSDKVVRYCPSQSPNSFPKGLLPLQLVEEHLRHSKLQFMDPELYKLAFNQLWSTLPLDAHANWLAECERQRRTVNDGLNIDVASALKRLPEGMQQFTKDYIIGNLTRNGYVNSIQLTNAIALYNLQMEQWKELMAP